MKQLAGMLGTILLVVVALGCNGDAISTPQPTSTPTVDPSPTLAPKQEFRVNLGGEPSSLDPQRASSLPEFSVIRQIFQGLIGFKPDLTLEPVVATEVPTEENGGISEDGLVYTFNLRDDVTWSDGEKLTASDFVFAIKRLLDPQVAAPTAGLYGSIKGGREYNSATEEDEATRQSLRDALAVEARDELSLVITLAEPNPTFLQKMALTPAFPVRQSTIEQFGDGWTEPEGYVGNGPYVMTEWVHQDHITLEVNPNYWGPRPNLTTISFEMIGDPNSELSAYLSDELDLAQVPPGTERATLEDPNLSRELLRSTALFHDGLFFNTTAEPFDNLKVRQAFATAIDREAWIDKVRSGVGHPAVSWLPPDMPGYDPELGQEYAFNADRARALLAEAEFAEGTDFPEITLSYINVGDQGLMAEFLQEQMRQNLDVTVNLEPLDPPSFFGKVAGAGQFQWASLGWGADYPDPENFLAPLFTTGSQFNLSRFSNPAFDALAAQAATELDQAKRIGLWQQAHEIVVSQVPVAPFFYRERFFLKKPSVQGLTLTGVDGFIPGDTGLAEVSIAP